MSIHMDVVDAVVVDRLTAAIPTSSTPAERIEAVRILTGRGLSAAQIAARLGCTERSVVRLRARIRVVA